MILTRATPALLARLGIGIAVAATWSPSTTASEETTLAALAKATHFHGIAVDANNPKRILLATHHGLYAVGLDGMARRISETRDDFMGFTAHPADPSLLYASGHPARGGNLGFVASKDGGRSWTQLSRGVNGPVDFHQMDVSKADPNVIYGFYRGVQRSADGGRTWHMVGLGPAGIMALAASSKNVDLLYAGTENGLQRSTDGGRTWTRESDRPATMVHVTRKGTVYAFMIGIGLARADEAELKWQTIGKGFGDDFILHFAADPTDEQRLYAVTLNPKTHAQSVIASRDGGASWSRIGADQG